MCPLPVRCPDVALCVVLDARQGSWRTLRAVQRALAPLSLRTGLQLVLRHDTFWEKQRVTCGRAEDDLQVRRSRIRLAGDDWNKNVSRCPQLRYAVTEHIIRNYVSLSYS